TRSRVTFPFAKAALGALLLGACSKTSASEAPSSSAAASVSAAAAKVDAAPPSPQGPAPDLNVLMITVDSLRADMPWAGYERPIAPNLTELEKHAVSYTRAYSLSSYTSMSLGGLLGGKYPGEMKRDGNFFGKYRDNPMFPEKLHAAGIRTLTAHAHL